MIDLKGQTALITGGARGIGQEISLKLARAGADIAVCDLRKEDAAQTLELVQALGRKAYAFSADVSKSDSVENLFKEVATVFPVLDILVNNAGITRDTLLMRMKDEDWDLVLNINLKGSFYCMREAVRPMMKARKGKIINIASVVGLMGNAGQANYSASKAGLIGLTKTVAREMASRNVCVNAVAPGFIKTAMTDKLTDADKAKLTTNIPMQKLGMPEDVANAVLFLASPLADYITGQVLTVDGGLVMA